MRGWQDFLIIRNKIKGLGQGFRNKEQKYRIRTGILGGSDTVLGTGTIIGTLAI